MNFTGDKTLPGLFIPALALVWVLVLAGCGNKSGLVLPPDPQSQAPDSGGQSTLADQPEQDPKPSDE